MARFSQGPFVVEALGEFDEGEEIGIPSGLYGMTLGGVHVDVLVLGGRPFAIFVAKDSVEVVKSNSPYRVEEDE